MDRRTLILGLIGATYVGRCYADAWWLITKDEYAEMRTRAASSYLRIGSGNDPQILVNQPNLNSTVKSPLAIQLEFRPAAGAAVDPKTFKVVYKKLGIPLDLTNKLTGNAQVKLTSSGLSADGAQLPSGTFLLELTIQDSLQRTGGAQIQFTVA